MTKQKLHWLIALEIGLILISLKAEWFGIGHIGLDSQLQEWVTSEKERDLTQTEWVSGIVALTFFPCMIFSWVWLWMLKPYSRALYTALVLIGFAFYPLAGAYVSNGWIDIVNGIGLVVTGMIIGALYFTDIYDLKNTAEQGSAHQSTTRSESKSE